MGNNILPQLSLPVYLNLPFECNITYIAIMLSMALYAMQWRLWSSGYHAKKPYKAPSYKDILIFVASFCAFFLCVDSQNDFFTWLVPHELFRLPNKRSSWGKDA